VYVLLLILTDCFYSTCDNVQYASGTFDRLRRMNDVSKYSKEVSILMKRSYLINDALRCCSPSQNLS